MVIQPVMKLCILPILLLLSTSHAQAAEYYRCTNPNGATVFSQQPCGPDASAAIIDLALEALSNNWKIIAVT